MIISDRRLGVFKMALQFIDDSPAAARAVMGQVIVLRTDLRIENGEIEYLAICEAFSPVPEGNIAPRYSAIVRSCEDGSTVFDSWSAI